MIGLEMHQTDHRVGQDLCQFTADRVEHFYHTDHRVGQDMCQANIKPRQKEEETETNNINNTRGQYYFITDHRVGQDLFGY